MAGTVYRREGFETPAAPDAARNCPGEGAGQCFTVRRHGERHVRGPRGMPPSGGYWGQRRGEELLWPIGWKSRAGVPRCKGDRCSHRLAAGSGIVNFGPIGDYSLAQWDSVLAVNLTGAFQGITRPLFLHSGGARGFHHQHFLDRGQ